MDSNILKGNRLESVNNLLIIAVAFVFVNTTCELVFYMLPVKNSTSLFIFYLFKLLSLLALVRPLIAGYLRGLLPCRQTDLFFVYSNLYGKYLLMSLIKYFILLIFSAATLIP